MSSSKAKGLNIIGVGGNSCLKLPTFVVVGSSSVGSTPTVHSYRMSFLLTFAGKIKSVPSAIKLPVCSQQVLITGLITAC
jgi:hypothetical protein